LKSRSAISRPSLGVLAAAFLLAGIFLSPNPANGQEMSLIRDTETEYVIRSYLDPLLYAAGLNPHAVQLHIVNDPSINAFVSGGQHLFVHTGLITNLESANQLVGVLAHETGHIAGGHLIRTREGARAASVPMLLSMAAGLAVAVAGLPEAGMALMMSGQNFAMGSFFAFTRTQESIADQSAIRYLEATGQSGRGMLELFGRFEGQEILTYQRQQNYARSHPAPRDRIGRLQNLVEASPYADKEDSFEVEHAFQMLRAKLRGYTNRPEATLRLYPESDTSAEARYARAMAYFRQPNMAKAFEEIESLLAEDPDNPYFLEMYGQINVDMGRVAEGIGPYGRAVELMPDAPQIRAAFGSALFGTGTPEHIERARIELELALQQDRELWFAWYELAKAYNQLGMQGEAQLATAERYFTVGAYPLAVQFAYRAQQRLENGTRDWQRANDIMAVAQAQLPNNARN